MGEFVDIQGRTFDEERNVPKQAYQSDAYFSAPLLASVCEQLVRVHRSRPNNVLEIGKGSGFVSGYLSNAGIPIHTFDINPALEPDIVGNVVELTRHVAEKSYDVVLCSEVLEHMPLELSKVAIAEIAKVARKKVIISLPVCQYKLLDIQAKVFVRFRRRLDFDINLFRAKRGKTISKLHHWEVDSSDATSAKQLRAIFEQSFRVLEESRSRLCPYHLFFELEPKPAIG